MRKWGLLGLHGCALVEGLMMFYLWEEELNTYWDDRGSTTFTKTQLTFKVYALNSDK